MARTMTTDTVLQKRLLDHLRTAVMMLDGDLRVRYLNPAAEMLLATSATPRQAAGHITSLPCLRQSISGRTPSILDQSVVGGS